RCAITGRNQQDGRHPKPACDQRSSYADPVGAGSSETVEVPAVFAQWRSGRSGNTNNGKLLTGRRLDSGCKFASPIFLPKKSGVGGCRWPCHLVGASKFVLKESWTSS